MYSDEQWENLQELSAYKVVKEMTVKDILDGLGFMFLMMMILVSGSLLQFAIEK